MQLYIQRHILNFSYCVRTISIVLHFSQYLDFDLNWFVLRLQSLDE